MNFQILTRKLVADAVVARFGQAVCFGAAVLIPLLALRRFTELELTEAELLMAVLTTMSMALLCAVLGLLVYPKTPAS